MRHCIIFILISLFVPVVVFAQSKNKHILNRESTNNEEVQCAGIIANDAHSRLKKMPHTSFSSSVQGQPIGSALTKNIMDGSQISTFSFQSNDWSYYESCPFVLSNGDLLVIWAKYYGDTLFSVKSTDGGITWSTPAFVNLSNGWCYSMCGMKIASGRIIVTWQNNSDGMMSCYSDNDGVTWSTPSSITNDFTDYYSTLTQTLDGKVWFCYGRFSPTTSYDIFYRTSTDNGVTWSSEQVLLATSSNELYGNIISKDPSTLLAFYRSGTYIYYKTSTDGGSTWSSDFTTVNATAAVTRPRVLRQADGTLWLAYQYYKNTTGGLTQSDIYYTKSTDGGSTWTTPTYFTNYAGYDGWFNACLLNNQPLITFSSDRWSTFFGQYHLWYGIIGTSNDDNTPPALITYSNSSPMTNTPVSIQAYVDDESGIAGVQINYDLNGVPYGPIQMYDDGLHNDDAAGDKIYGADLGPFQLGDNINYSISITDINSNIVDVYVSSFDITPVHNAGNIILKFNSNSELGDEGISLGSSAYWPKTNGYDYLYLGGLWVGCNVGGQDLVIKRFYNNSDWQRTDGTPFTLTPGVSDQDGDVTYDDLFASSPIGLQVHQQSYQWSDSTRDDFIIFKYTITNRGTNGTLNNIYVGSWTDPDVPLLPDPVPNSAGYDSQRHLVYTYNPQGVPSGYFGVKLLGSSSIPSTVYSWRAGQFDERNNFPYYQCLTQGNITFPDSSGDVRMLMTSTPFSLTPGSSQVVAFGIVLGDGLAELHTHADTMETIFNNQVVTSIDEKPTSNVIPKEYNLHQNYPNPFNPSTVIVYSIPKSGFVSLKVCDILGRVVATLVDEIKPAGTYRVTWDAGEMPSGVYFYRLVAGNFTETKKLLLLH